MTIHIIACESLWSVPIGMFVRSAQSTPWHGSNQEALPCDRGPNAWAKNVCCFLEILAATLTVRYCPKQTERCDGFATRSGPSERTAS